MRVTKQKAAENRERVVAATAQLMRERGFDGVSVAELMASAGMTHGGFYNHFETKADVEAAALEHAFAASVARIEAVADARAFAEYCASYVSAKARDSTAASCPMVAFAADVSRQGEAVREAYSKGLATYLTAFAAASGAQRAEAIRRFAALTGALTLARSVAATDPALSNEILAAARVGVDARNPAAAPLAD